MKKITGIPDNLDKKYASHVKELITTFDDVLTKTGTDSFIIIYGSYANAKCNDKSDIDIGVGVQEYVDGLSTKLSKIVTEFHGDNKLGIDNEVPLEKKLVNTFDVFLSSSNLGGFEINNGNILVPKIQKTKKYLNSDKLLKRLLFNKLTVPIISSSSNYNRLIELQNNANKNLFLLGIGLNLNSFFSIKDIKESLYKSNEGEEGEMFLGYKKDYDILDNYLDKILKEQINFFLQSGIITESNNNGLYKVNNNYYYEYIKKIL